MATSAVARETLFSLRRTIARIEGTLPERLEVPSDAQHDEGIVLRHNGVAVPKDPYVPTGVRNFDAALGGGLPKAALTEIHGRQTRDAGSVAGFALSLAGLILKRAEERLPILWIGTHEIFQEAGFPYAPGLHSRFGIKPENLLIARMPKLVDALWVAEEAAQLRALSLVLLEIRGNSQRLDLTATRRLHRRAQLAGRPIFLLRQAAQPEPTAATLRLVISPAPAASRQTMEGALDGSIGPPGFTVRIDKSRLARTGQFTLEWNADDYAFEERRAALPEDTRSVVSASDHRTDISQASGEIVAFAPANTDAAIGGQPSREERPAHRGNRRAG